jgi:hypothetical protein
MPEVTSMWFYLFASNEKYPDPESEIKSLAELDEGGRTGLLEALIEG